MIVFTSLYFSPATEIASGRVQEEPLVVFTNGDVACDHMGKPGIQRVNESNRWKS